MLELYSPFFVFVLSATILLQTLNYGETCLQSVGKEFGQNAARELGGSVNKASQDLSNSLKETSDKLSRSIDKGVEATAATVRELAGSVKEMAKSVSVRIDSGDLAHIGSDATKHIKDALVELSENWKLAVNTADLKDVGSEAARYLSEAIQNVNIKINLYLGVDDNVVKAVKYISIAAGIAFSVCFIAIVISVRQCRSCTMSLINACVEGCRSCRNSDTHSSPIPQSSEKPDMELQNFLDKNNAIPNDRNDNDKNYRKSGTLKDYKDFEIRKNFWKNVQVQGEQFST